MCKTLDALKASSTEMQNAVRQIGILYKTTDVETGFACACQSAYGPGSGCFAHSDIILLQEGRLTQVPEYVQLVISTFLEAHTRAYAR